MPCFFLSSFFSFFFLCSTCGRSCVRLINCRFDYNWTRAILVNTPLRRRRRRSVCIKHIHSTYDISVLSINIMHTLCVFVRLRLALGRHIMYTDTYIYLWKIRTFIFGQFRYRCFCALYASKRARARARPLLRNLCGGGPGGSEPRGRYFLASFGTSNVVIRQSTYDVIEQYRSQTHVAGALMTCAKCCRHFVKCFWADFNAPNAFGAHCSVFSVLQARVISESLNYFYVSVACARFLGFVSMLGGCCVRLA